MVFKRSMLNWRRGWGQSAMGICALCYIYMRLMWCNGFLEIYAPLEEGVCGLMWCNGFPKIYAQLQEGSGVNLPWVYMHCAIYETYLV